MAGQAGAQQVDFAVGGSTLFAYKSYNASLASPPPTEKGGSYAGFSVQMLRWGRLGLNAELVSRAKQGWYDGYQRYRPVFYDVNAVYATGTPWFKSRTQADFMAGVGGETLIFYNTYANCTLGSGVCVPHLNSTHFAVHAGGDFRYYLLGNLFVRPEAHVYYIPNNYQFHSNFVLRAGASIGYTFGR